MNDQFIKTILESTGASDFRETEVIQTLWSGYGSIIRLQLQGSEMNTVVIKLVQIPDHTDHPRGWNTNIGHQRKVRSYEVEYNWYRVYSHKSMARLPKCFAADKASDEVLIVLEDLDAAGYPIRKQHISLSETERCIDWLAKFHAAFLHHPPENLWPVGTYWHLATRPDELEALEDTELRAAAGAIDARLNQSRFQTLVHGDAKLANFCFSPDGEVAAVDFQYVGRGCGMKDLAYFIGSCMDEKESEEYEGHILDTYFEAFHHASGNVNEALETEWRDLYPVAWADFHRFLKGWSPGHWKINDYSERITRKVIQNLAKWT